MAIRYLLDRARTVDECMKLLSNLDLGSSRSLTFCDDQKAANVEILNNEFRWTCADEIVHSNHFLNPDFRDRDELNVFAKNGSMARLQTCQTLLKMVPSASAPDAYFAVLSTDPICVHGDGHIRREATVAAVVMKPRQRELFVRKGYPCIARTQRITIGEVVP